MPEKAVNYDDISPLYNRRYHENDYSGVQRTLHEFLSGCGTGPVLEVGCGTAHWLHGPQMEMHHPVGIDPSAGMLQKGRQSGFTGGLVQGRAETLPFVECTFKGIFCINAFQHFSDKPRFIVEAFRVLQPGGGLMTVALDPHRGLDSWCIYDYFPATLEIDRKRYPPASGIVQWLESAGFQDCRTIEAQHIPVQIEARFALESGRLDRSVTSQLAILSEAEYLQGINNIQAALAEAEKQHRTLMLHSDLHLYTTFGWKK